MTSITINPCKTLTSYLHCPTLTTKKKVLVALGVTAVIAAVITGVTYHILSHNGKMSSMGQCLHVAAHTSLFNKPYITASSTWIASTFSSASWDRCGIPHCPVGYTEFKLIIEGKVRNETLGKEDFFTEYQKFINNGYKLKNRDFDENLVHTQIEDFINNATENQYGIFSNYDYSCKTVDTGNYFIKKINDTHYIRESIKNVRLSICKKDFLSFVQDAVEGISSSFRS